MSQSQTSTSLRNTSFHSGGMPTGLAIHEREREEERKRRRAKAKIERQLSDSIKLPLFAEPRKVQPSSEDLLQQQIKATLPEFDTIAPVLQHHNHLIGIMRLPQTPVDKKPKGVFSFDTEHRDSKNSTDLKNAKLSVANTHMSARSGTKKKEHLVYGKAFPDRKINGAFNGTFHSTVGSSNVSKIPESGTLGKSSLPQQSLSPSAEHTPVKSAETKNLDVKPVVNGHLKSQHSNAKDKVKDKDKGSKESSKMQSDGKKKEPFPEKPSKTSMASKSKPPKLSMPERNFPLCSGEESHLADEPTNVEEIVAEMQKVAPPLTGIHTPIKGGASIFAFKENSLPGSIVKKKMSENPEEKADGSSELLHSDLMLSDDESDDEHGHRTSLLSKANGNNRSGMHSSSSSDSSSGDSESDSSDSDSDSSGSDTNNNTRNKKSSPVNSPLSSPKPASDRNWGLGHLEKTLCPATNIVTTKTKPSPSSSNPVGGEGLRGNQAAPAPNANMKSSLNSHVGNGIPNELKSPLSESADLAPFAEELLTHSPEVNHGIDIESITAKLEPSLESDSVGTEALKPLCTELSQSGLTMKIQLPKGSEKKEVRRRGSTTGSKLNSSQEKSSGEKTPKKCTKPKKDSSSTKGGLNLQHDVPNKGSKSAKTDNKDSAGKKLAKVKTEKTGSTEKESVKPASDGDDEDIIVDIMGDERTPLLETVKADSKPAAESKRKDPEKTKVAKNKPPKLTNGHLNGKNLLSSLVSPNRLKDSLGKDVEITFGEDNRPESLIVKIDLALLKRIPKIPGIEPVRVKHSASSPVTETNGSCDAVSPSSVKHTKRQSSVDKTVEEESSKKAKVGSELESNQKKHRERSSSASSLGSRHSKDAQRKRSLGHENDTHCNKRQRHDSESSKGLDPVDQAVNHSTQRPVEVSAEISERVPQSHQCSCDGQKANEQKDSFITSFYDPTPRVPYGPDHYLNEAKKLKHKADSLNDKEAKAFLYIGAVLYFVRCGKALEQNEESESRTAHQMYSQTLDLLRCTMRSYVSRVTNHTDGGADKRLAALCMRIQSILYMRLYRLRKDHVMKNVKAVTEHFKGPPKSAQAPSPYTSNAKITGTPSPLSPTPSPSGSVGSVGSVGSTGSNEAVTTPSRNGKQTNAMTSPVNVCIPQKIHSMTAQHVLQANNLLYSHDLWDQSQAIVLEHKDFFMELDRKCGPLTLHSSIVHMIDYVEQGLKHFKEMSKADKASS